MYVLQASPELSILLLHLVKGICHLWELHFNLCCLCFKSSFSKSREHVHEEAYKYRADNNRTHRFQYFCFNHWNVHVYYLSLLNSFPWKCFKIWLLSQRIYKHWVFKQYLPLCYFSSNFQSICIVLDKAPHTFEECFCTCFIWVQIPGSSAEKGRIWYKFYYRNSKQLGIEQMPLTNFTLGRPPVSHALEPLSKTSGFKLTV